VTRGAIFVLVATSFLTPLGVSQTQRNNPDCPTTRHFQHKVSCLCGAVQICSGDVCGRPSTYDLDDDITVELRDRSGTKVLESEKVGTETRKRECTTSTGVKAPCNTSERTFCFEGKRKGHYQLAFVLYTNGAPQPAIRFPINYSSRWHKACDSTYMVPPTCSR
jgi:hypothetical protein